MTRDEAIALLCRGSWNPLYSSAMNVIEAQKFVSAAAALGVLKLDDERKDDTERVGKAFLLFGDRFTCADHMRRALEAANLQIVEK